jgi:oligoribonuclease NrnB/cAMP/cGMP phosphodiesterase (DHH superfamily)
MAKHIYYHGSGCYDGFTSAWVAWKMHGDKASYYPSTYDAPLVDSKQLTEGDTAYFLDYSRAASELRDFDARGVKVLVLDHHASAERDLSGLRLEHGSVIFDMTRSGAGMAWDYFFSGKERPRAVNYIEDRDLWTFRHPGTPLFHAYLTSLSQIFEQWDIAMSDYNHDRAIVEGTAIARTIDQYAEKMLPFVVRGATLMGHSLAVFNAPPMNVSETHHRVLEEHPTAEVSLSFHWRHAAVECSLRSRRDGPDVGRMAKNFGGGGHANAAGFRLALDSKYVPWLLGLSVL